MPESEASLLMERVGFPGIEVPDAGAASSLFSPDWFNAVITLV